MLGALKAQEFERSQVSRFLHDAVGQNLTAMGLQLDLLRMDLETISPQGCTRIAEMQKVLEVMMEETREYTYALNPSDVERAGLRSALDRMVGRLRERFPGTVSLNVDPSLKIEKAFASAAFSHRPGGRGECRATFQLLYDRNRGKVHTCRSIPGGPR